MAQTEEINNIKMEKANKVLADIGKCHTCKHFPKHIWSFPCSICKWIFRGSKDNWMGL